LELFNFEKLIAWQKSVEFYQLVIENTEAFASQSGHFRIKEQLESATFSIALNIAEGAGRSSDQDFVRFLYYARGSLYETVTLLILLNKNGHLDDEGLALLREKAQELAKILNGLISSKKN